MPNGGLSWPRDYGEWGAALRWRPDALDGTVGLYYRRYTDKFAAVLVEGSPPAQYRQFYGEGVDLLGLSFSTQALGVSVGADASYRHDTPLLAQSPALTAPPPGQPPSLLFPNGLPTLRGNTYQARGDTVHGVVNAVGVAAGIPGMSSASWALEVVYSRWLAVRENEDMFYAVGHGVCRSDPALAAAGLAKTTADGCATRDSVGVGAGLTPTWFQALAGVDLYAPLALSWTVAGNSPVTFGGNEGSGTYGFGIGADVRSRYRLDLRYAGYFGRASDDGTRVTSVNGLPALLRSRGNVTFTAKATF